MIFQHSLRASRLSPFDLTWNFTLIWWFNFTLAKIFYFWPHIGPSWSISGSKHRFKTSRLSQFNSSWNFILKWWSTFDISPSSNFIFFSIFGPNEAFIWAFSGSEHHFRASRLSPFNSPWNSTSDSEWCGITMTFLLAQILKFLWPLILEFDPILNSKGPK